MLAADDQDVPEAHDVDAGLGDPAEIEELRLAVGAVKMMDFGIARAPTDSTNRLTQTAAAIGTAQYMAPEHVTGRPVSRATDIYALGAVASPIPSVRMVQFESDTADPSRTNALADSGLLQVVQLDGLDHSLQRPGQPAASLDALRAVAERIDRFLGEIAA